MLWKSYFTQSMFYTTGEMMWCCIRTLHEQLYVCVADYNKLRIQRSKEWHKPFYQKWHRTLCHLYHPHPAGRKSLSRSYLSVKKELESDTLCLFSTLQDNRIALKDSQFCLIFRFCGLKVPNKYKNNVGQGHKTLLSRVTYRSAL